METKQVICESIIEATLDGIDPSQYKQRKALRRLPAIGSSTVFSWACAAILKTFGEEWLDVGWIDITYLLPVFPGDTLATRLIKTSMAPNDRSPLELIVINQDNQLVASGWVGMGVNTAWLPLNNAGVHHQLAIAVSATSASDGDDLVISPTSSQVEVPKIKTPQLSDDLDDEAVGVDSTTPQLSTSTTSSSLAFPAPPIHHIPGSKFNASSPPSLAPVKPLRSTPSHQPSSSPGLRHNIAFSSRPRLFPLPPVMDPKEAQPRGIDILPKSLYVSPQIAKDFVRREAKDANSMWHRPQNPPVHPGWVADQISHLIQHSDRRLPAVHTNTKLQFFSRLISGQRVTTTGHFRRGYDKNSNHYCVVDGMLLNEQGQRLAQMQHVTIFQLRSAL